MRSLICRISAVPVPRDADSALAGGIALVLAMLIIPLPEQILDVMLALNMSLGAVILVAALTSEKVLAMSGLPSLLLLTTLYRLSLNVSTTRMILSEADAGTVVTAFGKFVARGDIVLGLVIFVILTIVQLMVIGKGAERVAEVGARFSLDAMPGKQMSIDASIRSGHLSEEEGEEKRSELQRESQFYGAMDGAMKFVKGDATAGLIMTALNLVAGMAIGVLNLGMTAGEAMQTYTVLTIGDGLVSQIPALLITLAAGVVATRVAGKEPNAALGSILGEQLLGRTKVLGISSAFACALGLVPGLPTLPFLLVGVALGVAALVKSRGLFRSAVHSAEGGANPQTETREKAIEKHVKRAKAQRAVTDNLAPTVALVSLDVGADLSQSLGLDQGPDEETELLGELIPQLREAMFMDMGVHLPGIRIRSYVEGLPGDAIMIKVKETPVAVHTIRVDRALAVEEPSRLERLGLDVEPVIHPMDEREVGLVPLDAAPDLEAARVAVWSPSGVVALHLIKALRQHVRELVGLQEAAEAVERLRKVCPDLVTETIPKVVTMAQLTDVLQRLLDERVSIRDLKSILEALARFGGREADGVSLTEHVRSALSLQLAFEHAGYDSELEVILLDPVLEDVISDGIVHEPGGTYLALPPEIRESITNASRQTLEPVLRAGARPIVLTHAGIRRFVRKVFESTLPDVVVLSFEELPGHLSVHPIGRVRVAGI